MQRAKAKLKFFSRCNYFKQIFFCQVSLLLVVKYGMVQVTTMSVADLNAIIMQLQDLARNTVSVAPALPSMPLPLPLPQPAYNQLPLTIMPIANVSADAISSALSALISQPPTITPVVAPLAQKVMPPVPDVSQLFVAAGLISDHGSAILSGAAQYKMTHLILSLSLSLSQLQLIPS
jgi:hypothetical protein